MPWKFSGWPGVLRVRTFVGLNALVFERQMLKTHSPVYEENLAGRSVPVCQATVQLYTAPYMQSTKRRTFEEAARTTNQ
jgi:hypothetical protein